MTAAWNSIPWAASFGPRQTSGNQLPSAIVCIRAAPPPLANGAASAAAADAAATTTSALRRGATDLIGQTMAAHSRRLTIRTHSASRIGQSAARTSQFLAQDDTGRD
jgi:hypothetical protein